MAHLGRHTAKCRVKQKVRYERLASGLDARNKKKEKKRAMKDEINLMCKTRYQILVLWSLHNNKNNDNDKDGV